MSDVQGSLPFEDRASQLGGQSARSQRRNAQRTRTMGGHPSSIGRLPQATEMGQGQLFANDPFQRARETPNLGSSPGFGIPQGWGRPQGRPKYPGQGGSPHPQEPGPQPRAVQPELFHPPAGPGQAPQPTPEALPPRQPEKPEPGFADKGFGKYYMRNKNGRQFNKPAIHKAVGNVLDAYADSQYFAHQGMGAAIRYTMDLPQVPSHRADAINSRNGVLRGHGITGINPGNMEAEIESRRPRSAGETPLSFDERHGQNPDLSW